MPIEASPAIAPRVARRSGVMLDIRVPFRAVFLVAASGPEDASARLAIVSYQ